MLPSQSLAERAPHLFRKKIISVDLLLDNDEKMLQIITGCFSGTGGGVPEVCTPAICTFAQMGAMRCDPTSETCVCLTFWRVHRCAARIGQRGDCRAVLGMVLGAHPPQQRALFQDLLRPALSLPVSPRTFLVHRRHHHERRSRQVL